MKWPSNLNHFQQLSKIEFSATWLEDPCFQDFDFNEAKSSISRLPRIKSLPMEPLYSLREIYVSGLNYSGLKGSFFKNLTQKIPNLGLWNFPK